jgi:uncharacterized protein (TIGR02453 family)
MLELTRFNGFGADATSWFEGLAQDNSKAYFDRTRTTYEADVRDPLAALLHELTQDFGGKVKVFRQNRDIRFSADKSPYKLNTYGIIFDRPKTPTGLYVSISAKGLYAATGYWQMAPDQLERYRAAAADAKKGRALETIVADVQAAGLEVVGEQLKTVPRGYPRDHERARLLAHKDLIAGQLMPPGAALLDRRAYDFAAATWRTAEPLVKWLDRHVGDSTVPEQRFGRH